MKKFIVIISFALCILSSCSKDSLNDNIRLDDIVGSWYGTSSYINPVSGRKYQYLEFSFYSDYTGEFYRDTPSGITVGYFNYKIKGNVIKCSGYVVYSDGDMEERDIELLKEGDRLIPQTTYTNFILTMDGSVETDMEGNELIDNTQLLLNVWVCNSSPLVMDIENSRTYCEYILK